MDDASKHIPLAKCRVLYLGSAVPLETKQGIDAVQIPLRERYPLTQTGEVPGIDAWVTAFSSGLLLSYTNDNNSSIWFPISNLILCASVKCQPRTDPTTGATVATFIPLDSEEAKQTTHPPIFTCIIRRPMGVKVLECHSFICKTERAAMALVHACTHAYEHKEGWVEGEPPASLRPSGRVSVQDTKLPNLVPASSSIDSVPAEFYEKPPIQGYYYGNKGLIKNYNVYDNDPTKTVVVGVETDELAKKKKVAKTEPAAAKPAATKKTAKTTTKTTTTAATTTPKPTVDTAAVKPPAAKKSPTTAAATPKAAVKPQPVVQPQLMPMPGMMGMMPPPGMFPPGIMPPPGMMITPPGLMPPPPGCEMEFECGPPIPIMMPVPLGMDPGMQVPAGMNNYFADWDPYSSVPPVVFLPLGPGESVERPKYCQKHQERQESECPDCRRAVSRSPPRERRRCSRSPDRRRSSRSPERRRRSPIIYDEDPRRYRDMRPSFFVDDPNDLVLFAPRSNRIDYERERVFDVVPLPPPRREYVVDAPPSRDYDIRRSRDDLYRRRDECMDYDDRRGPPLRRDFDDRRDRSDYGPPPRRDFDDCGPPPRRDFDDCGPPRRDYDDRRGDRCDYGPLPRRRDFDDCGPPPRRDYDDRRDRGDYGPPPRRDFDDCGPPPRRDFDDRRDRGDYGPLPRRRDFDGDRDVEYSRRIDDDFRGREEYAPPPRRDRRDDFGPPPRRGDFIDDFERGLGYLP